jgi:hypothetical protein
MAEAVEQLPVSADLLGELLIEIVEMLNRDRERGKGSLLQDPC